MTPPLTWDDVLAIGALLAVIAAVAGIVAYSRLPRPLKLLIYAALALRVVGAWLRYTILFEFYRGRGDANRYFRQGVEYAERFWNLDFSPFYDPTLWGRGRWWGTPFVDFPSGIVVSLIGPSFLGEFIAFSFLSFLGLVGFAIAFRRAYPGIPFTSYARWIWLFPSLWYWPSALGKEAIVLMGLGLAVAGFIGRKGRINWLLLVTGTFFVFAIRPQVAAVVILSIVIGYWLSLEGRWTIGKAIQGVLILGVGLGGIWISMKQIGVDGFDAEGVQSYMEDRSSSAAVGHSGIDNVEVGLTGIPMAMVNILTRPFPWEARNPQMFVSALEIMLFWAIVWFRRRNLVNALRGWRSDRFLRMAVPFILIYSITLGMLVVNMGIIARQRVFLFPFLFLLIEAMPARRKEPNAVRLQASAPFSPDGHRRMAVGGVR